MALIPVNQRIDEIVSHTESKMGITTGIPELDMAILGFRPGHLIVVAGFSGIGKSAIMTDFALAAATEAPIVLFSIEMGVDMTIDRMVYNVADLNYHKGMRGDLTGSEQKKLEAASESVKKLNDILIDESTDTLHPSWMLRQKDKPENSMEMVIEEGVAKGAKVFIIDYLQIVQYGFKSESESLRIKQITGKLHKLSVKHGITIIALAQLKKEVGDRLAKKQDPTPTLSDIRDSGFIINDSDIILLLHRESYFEKKEDLELFDNLVEDAQIIVAKQRNGPVGPINVKFHCCSMSYKSEVGF